MALLTIPTTPTKATFQTYSLNTSDLIALISDNYFKEIANWARVVVTYTSTVSNQVSLITFAPEDVVSLAALGFFSAEARTSFQVSNISVYDKQNGRYRLERNQIPDVDNYNLIFLSATSGSWFNMYGSGGNDNKLSFNQSKTELYVGTGYDAYYGSIAYFMLGIEGISGSVVAGISNLINHSKTDTYFVNSDQSKVYIVGAYGLTYFENPLPAITVGANYAASPPRILSIDVANGDVTWLADVETLGTNSSFGNHIHTMIVDEVLNIAVCTGSMMISCYNTLSGAPVWSKDAGIAPADYRWGEFYPRKIADFGNDFIVVANSYNGVTLPGKIPLRISKSTGLDTELLPIQPIGYLGLYMPFWQVTPDLSKIVVATSAPSSQTAFTYFDGTSWSSQIPIADAVNQCDSLAVTNDYLIVQSGYGKFSKVDYAGTNIPGFTSPVWPPYTAPGFANPLAIVDGKLLSGSAPSALLQLSASTGVISTTFKGAAGGFVITQTIGSNVFLSKSTPSSTYIPLISLPEPTLREYGTVGFIDSATAELTGTTSGAIGNTVQFTGSNIMGSDLYPDLVLYMSNSGNCMAYNKITKAYESGWPIATISYAFVASLIDNYIYVLNYTAGTMSYSDSEGTFTTTASLLRINLVTKAFDRTFGVTIPGYTGNTYGTQTGITATNDYVYVCVPGQAISRVKKSDSSLQIITPATLGLSMPSFPIGRISFVEIEANKLVVFCDNAGSTNNSTSLDDKPYIFVTEDTLSQSYPQPSSSTTERNITLIVNVATQELAGTLYQVSYASSPAHGGYFVTYNLLTNTRSVGFNLDYSETGMYLNVVNGRTKFVVKDSDYYMYIASYSDSAYLFNFTPYYGIIKMNPMGIIID